MSSSSIYKQQFSELSSQEVRDIREGVNFSDPVQEVESVEIDKLIEGVDFSVSVRDGETSSVSGYCDDFSNKTEQLLFNLPNTRNHKLVTLVEQSITTSLSDHCTR